MLNWIRGVTFRRFVAGPVLICRMAESATVRRERLSLLQPQTFELSRRLIPAPIRSLLHETTQMTDQSRKEQLERRLEQSIRMLRQVDDPTTRKRLHALTEALEREKEREKK